MSVIEGGQGSLLEKNTYQKIDDVVRRIPEGKVATYGQIAVLAGNPRWARVVGYALHHNPEPGVIACHRVVSCNGSVAASFAFGGAQIQRALLENEGVIFKDDGRVDLKVCLWQPRISL